MNYQHAYQELLQYIKDLGLDEKDALVKKKIVHSEQVGRLSQKLGKQLGLDQEQLEFVQILGLLHDIGRFQQFKESHCYSDVNSKLDHALLGVQYLFDQGHIVDFVENREFDHLFQVAIRNHNKLEIEEELTLEEEFYVHFLRDIDVIDIFRQEAVTSEFTYITVPTKEIDDQFSTHWLLDSTKVKNQSDTTLLEMAYVFGLHFQESYELLVESDNLNLFLDSIEVSRDLEEDFHNKKEEIYQYIIHQLEIHYEEESLC